MSNNERRKIFAPRPRLGQHDLSLDIGTMNSSTNKLSTTKSGLDRTAASVQTAAKTALSNFAQWEVEQTGSPFFSPGSSTYASFHPASSYETGKQSTLGKRSGGYQSHQRTPESDDVPSYYPSHPDDREPKRVAWDDSGSQPFERGEMTARSGSMSENFPLVKIEPGAGSPGRYWDSGYEIESAFPFSYQTRNHIKQEECVESPRYSVHDTAQPAAAGYQGVAGSDWPSGSIPVWELGDGFSSIRNAGDHMVMFRDPSGGRKVIPKQDLVWKLDDGFGPIDR